MITFAVWFIFLLVFLSTTFAGYLSHVAQGELAFSALMQLLAITIPSLSGLLLPMSFFVAILLGYGRLYAESEMTVLSACGMSQNRLLAYTMGFTSFIVLFVSLLVFWISPQLANYRAQILNDASSSNVFAAIAPKRFQQSSDGKFIFYVDKVSRDRQSLQSVFIAEKDQKPGSNNWDIVYAARAHKQHQEKYQGNFLVAEHGYRYVGTPGKKDYLIVKYHQYAVRLPQPNISPSRETAALPTSVLWREYWHNPWYASELQWRFSVPLQTFILALLALSFSRVKPRQGRYLTLLPAVLIYLVYVNLIFISRNWISEGKVSIALGMWWVHGILFLVAMGLFFSRQNWQTLFLTLLPKKKGGNA
ncbi:MAG: LPS export ABC transporter permease LptF [Gammaproteobacteria bacterium]|nr:LPS export ABC transporter permease LptF [Gammaproteobacteria bacterium]